MKSIKDAAEFFAYDDYFDCINEDAVEGFEAGANYVLKEIEEFQKLFSTCMNAHANGYLKSIIEQLKK